MELLKQRIQNEAKISNEGLVDVSSFFNGTVDAVLMDAIGKDFAKAFEKESIDVVATVESSGIAPALFTSLYLKKPLVIIKKFNDAVEHMLQQECYSYTKKHAYYLTTQAEFFNGKRVLLIDDFLASGSVVNNVAVLCAKANADLMGVGICISKNFQQGYQSLLSDDFKLYCQVQITNIDVVNQVIEFA